MQYNKIQTPEELLKFMDENIEYGVIDKHNKKITDGESEEFQITCNTYWTLNEPLKILELGVGHCYDQVEIERKWFSDHKYNFKTIWISAYQQNVEDSGFCHSYLIFEKDNKWNIFEHSDYSHRGIYSFDTIDEAIKFQANNQIEYASSCVKPLDKYSVCIKIFDTPPTYCTMNQYLKHINDSEDYIIDNN